VNDIPRHFTDGLLDGRVAVVTGGGSGIGHAIAVALAEVGADVVITSRSAHRLADAELALAESTGRLCASLPCDVRSETDIARLHDFTGARFGPASIVVNNAAANFRMPAERMSARAFRTVLDVDLMGTFLMTRQFLPDLIASGHGSVLSITVPGVHRGFPEFSHAGAAKAGIASMTCSWAREWGRYGIRVNSIAPGPVPTPGVRTNMLGRRSDTPGEAFDDLLGEVPLGRLGTPQDIAAAAVFLCSDAAGWISGVDLLVDGGFNVSRAARLSADDPGSAP
jgi:NAD(P)-dependent dehydrogenase (short-subunit alcohol dehydrogenase family)